MPKQRSKPSDEIMSYEEIHPPKKTPKKSATIKRPTDLSSIRRLGSRIGKKTPFGNSKPRKKKTGRTLLYWTPGFTSRAYDEETSITAKQLSKISLSKPKSYETIQFSSLPASTHTSVGSTKPTPVLKSLYKKFKFYLALVALLALAWVGARDYLNNWVATGAFVVSLWWAVEQLTKRGRI